MPEGQRELEITLMGEATGYLLLFREAVQIATGLGLGFQRVPFDILKWEYCRPVGGWQHLPDNSDAAWKSIQKFNLGDWLTEAPPLPWCFSFASPVRLRRHGSYLVEMDWPFFLECVAKRLEMLTVGFEAGQPVGHELWHSLSDVFQEPAKILGTFRWHDLERYSNRQRRKVPMGGLVGRAEIRECN